jgi:DNA-directed RNA polymerase specialized sigma24 family protein
MVAITGEGATLDAADVSALHQAHWPALWRLAVLLTSDPVVAEDLVQEAFARLLRVSGRRRGPGPGT